MNKIIVRAPVRADLAGGTLDLWPLYLFHPGSRTVNVALSRFAECEISSRSDQQIEVSLADQQYHRTYPSFAELVADERVALIARAVEHFRLHGIRIVTRSDVPRGSGLGASSALAVALVRALSEFVDQPVDGDELIALVRDLETRVLGCPAGIQDYYPAVFGGLAALHLTPGKAVRHPIVLPLPQLAEHLVVHYSGVSHFSGTNNWEIYKQQLDGDGATAELLERIAAISVRMEHALRDGDFAAAGCALADEWSERKALVSGITTPEIDDAIARAIDAGAWGGKVCGAGGGGCLVFLVAPDRRQAVLDALADAPGVPLDVSPIGQGLVVERTAEGAVPSLLARRARGVAAGESPEQLFVVSDERGRYRPFVFGEAAVTFDDAHKGLHQTLVRALLAPIDIHGGRVRWDEGIAVSAERLNLNATPDSDRELEIPADSDILFSAAVEGEGELRRLLQERERLFIYYNPAFGLYSEPSEDRDSFVRRCMEEATRTLESTTERLESSYRRRIDQMREKADRDQRRLGNDEETSESIGSEVGIAWGQTLFNITSGRPARTEAPQSVSEADYMERITQLQRLWEREREELRDELMSKARAVEEISIAPSERNIEVRKFVIIWAPSLRSALAGD